MCVSLHAAHAVQLFTSFDCAGPAALDDRFEMVGPYTIFVRGLCNGWICCATGLFVS
jgi:hypothetical protein